MYCSSCGVALAPGLTYCNHCGAKLSEAGSNVVRSREPKPESVISAMVVTFIFGLIAIAVLIGTMKSVLGLDAGQLMGFASLCFLIMIVLEGVFLRLLFRRNRATDSDSNNELLKKHKTKELDAVRTPLLREPAISVTDHTTRAFDPVYVERNKPTDR